MRFVFRRRPQIVPGIRNGDPGDRLLRGFAQRKKDVPVIVGMDFFGFGKSEEHVGDVRITFLEGIVRETDVMPACHRFHHKSLFENGNGKRELAFFGGSRLLACGENPGKREPDGRQNRKMQDVPSAESHGSLPGAFPMVSWYQTREILASAMERHFHFFIPDFEPPPFRRWIRIRAVCPAASAAP